MAALNNVELITALLSCNRQMALDSHSSCMRAAAMVNGFDIEFYQLSVYDIARLGERFDVVLFLGVLYHLRHPLLALDLISQHVVDDLLVVQSMLRGSVQTRGSLCLSELAG
jgi:tRNA (mo5U34)-methyltransferase